MSLFSKIGNWLKDKASPVINQVGKLASATGIPIVSQIGQGLDLLIPDSQQQKMVDAVNRDGVIKVDEVENTLQAYNPAMTPTDLVQNAQVVTSALLQKANSATIDDSKALTNGRMLDKELAFANKYKFYLLGGAAFLYVFRDKVFGRKRF